MNFGEMNLHDLFFSKIFLQREVELACNATHFIFFEALKLTREMLKLKWNSLAQKSSTFSNVHCLYISEGYKKLHVQIVYI